MNLKCSVVFCLSLDARINQCMYLYTYIHVYIQYIHRWVNLPHFLNSQAIGLYIPIYRRTTLTGKNNHII